MVYAQQRDKSARRFYGGCAKKTVEYASPFPVVSSPGFSNLERNLELKDTVMTIAEKLMSKSIERRRAGMKAHRCASPATT